MASAALLEPYIKIFENKLTLQEENLFRIFGSKAVKELASGTLIGCALALAATLKLNANDFTKSCLISVVGASFGFWRFKRSMCSWADHMLGMDGSPMQRNLANIIVKERKDYPWLMQRVSRHFYSEYVYDDTNLDKPMVRLRHRNHFGDILLIVIKGSMF
ncbi:uncharacterized protein [Euphorbia lathyris]|uniref:uncharacterized protein n=1 Tax=Euphorbia lathyris TaxID=212925 RepID=UPI0033142638